MQIRSRRFLGGAALFAAALGLVYLLFAWFAFEPLLKWYLPRWVEQRSGHHMALGQARLRPFALAVELQGLILTEPNHRPLLSLDNLLVDIDAVGLMFKRAYAFDELRVTAPRLRIELLPGGRMNWRGLLDAFAGPPAGAPDDAPVRLLLEAVALEGGHIDFFDQRVEGGFQTVIGPLQAELHHLSTLPEDRGGHSLTARTGIGAQLRWKGQLALNPLFASGEIEVDTLSLGKLWPYLQESLRMAPPEGNLDLKLRYRASYAERSFDLRVDGLDVNVRQLALKGVAEAQPSIALDALHLSGGYLDLRKRELGFDAIDIGGGQLALEMDAGDRLMIQNWLAPPSQSATPADAAPAWRLQLKRLAVDRLGLRLLNRAFAEPLTIEVGQLKLALQASGVLGVAEPQITVQDLGIELGGIRLSNKASPQPLLELARLGLDGGRLDLSDRSLALQRVFAGGARLTAVRDAQGRVALLDALRRVEPPPAGQAAAGKPWHYRIDRLEAGDVELALREESVRPAAVITLEGLRVEASGLSDDARASVPVKLAFDVRQGGRFEASGRLQPARQTGDLQFALLNLALAPAQPFVARHSSLLLVGGTASAKGRLQWQPGKPRLETSLAIKDLLLNEAQSGERFLGWRQLSGPKLLLTPQRIDLGELTLEGVGAKLIVFKDLTSNVAQLLRPQGETEPPAALQPSPPVVEAKPAPLALTLGRLRVVDGSMEFADLSLALPFGTRIAGLGGHLTGLSNRPDAPMQLALEGQVGEFGLARAAGQFRPLDPTGFADIRVSFRNVEMTTLTPYSATFAGRRIESGKLSLDLEYKVKQRQVLGDNKLIMERLVLGAHVDSASAMNLPLDLAIALLADSEGRIDLGLPVSGSLDDPQFSYGGLVWKALVSALTRVVSAPFRALGALLGVDADKLDRIVFDTGSAVLLPPEREKLKMVAELMAKRSALSIQVHGDYSSEVDGHALKGLRLRRAVARQGGRNLAEGEDPGPLASEQPATRAALETLYARRFGDAALQALRQQHAQANPQAPPNSSTGRLISTLASTFKPAVPPLSADEQQRLAGADLHGLLAERLLAAEAVDESQLRRIGQARGEAIRRELGGRGVADQRVSLAPPRNTDGSGVTVAVEIGLDAVAAGTARPAPAAVPADAASASSS